MQIATTARKEALVPLTASGGNCLTESMYLLSHTDLATHSIMRRARPFYLAAFFIYLALIFSSSSLLAAVETPWPEESFHPAPAWFLFASLAVVAPASLALSQVLPNPSVAVAVGGLMTSAGLLWTGLDTGHSQVLSFCVLTGCGISLVLQAAIVTISPYFIRSSVGMPASILALAMGTMLLVPPVMSRAVQVWHDQVFLYLSPLALLAAVMPAIGHWAVSRPRDDVTETDHQAVSSKADGCEKQIQDVEEGEVVGFSGILQYNANSLPYEGSWRGSLLSGLVWISWGGGVDTTWMSLAWRSTNLPTTAGLTTLQLVISFLLLTCKLAEFFSQRNSHCRPNLSSNYLHLGLLGVSGVALSLFPATCPALHNHLLFTLGLAMQYDDVTDLYLVDRGQGSPPCHQLVKHDLDLEEAAGSTTTESTTDVTTNNHPSNPVVGVACLLGHVITLVLMALLAMVLGIQVANLFGFLTTLFPLSYIFNEGGLLVTSVMAVGVALTRPDQWLQRDVISPSVIT